MEGDDAPGAPPFLILSFSTWRDHFCSDPGVIGMDVRMHGEPRYDHRCHARGIRLAREHRCMATAPDRPSGLGAWVGHRGRVGSFPRHTPGSLDARPIEFEDRLVGTRWVPTKCARQLNRRAQSQGS